MGFERCRLEIFDMFGRGSGNGGGKVSEDFLQSDADG
jgi:hypothetical protein